jgi:altronate dehydratase large subunit
MTLDLSHGPVDVLLMHPDDNVLFAVVDLPAGYVTTVGGDELTLPAAVLSGHKFARRDLAPCEIVVKYGQPIGRATAAIARGEHVHIHNVESLRGRGDLAAPAVLPLGQASASRPAPQPAGLRENVAGGLTFMGYRRRDGRAGVRNHVLVLPTVQCANGVVRRIGQRVPGAVAVPHVYGCSQLGDDLAQTTRVLEEFAGHPNVAAVLLVSLGCESLDAAGMAERLAARGVIVQLLSIQEVGGTAATADRGAGIVAEMVSLAGQEQRRTIPLSELVVGLECGGSDAWSGVTANPALGVASDLLIAAGGTAILSETPELIGAEHLLAARAEPGLGEALCQAVYRWEDEARRMGVDMRGAQPTPGNIAGGLTTIEEKSLGAISKGGSTPVQELLRYGHRPTRRGLLVMDTPGNDPESVTGMVAGGAQIVVFTTGRGTPAGCPITPVIKVATNTEMARRMADDIDINAGTIITDGESLDTVGERILAEIRTVAEGKLTAAEQWGNAEFSINMIGPRV